MTTASPAFVLAPSEAAFRILRVGFTVLPIVVGIDKFFNVLVDWTQYLPNFVTNSISGNTVMAIVGVIEIVAGIGVWLRPQIFANVVAAWLGVIIVTLLLAGGFWDIALRDFGLLLGAVALGQLARAHA
jgi:hypothetical protein